ncbi:tRNA (adenosine(37)-N6)-threonylcarbamoyltransferase complex ATPase subunit type 1 TsaE [candidate division KSB1 bacterium]|nr:tRNA (adenosine(37)-N6)-threonylcarbamoyltransferase complex ATPase subunit type 1 TsaE [candidate division KSB1 bacterium]RQW01163.1 MAG: tRNA (adenosine(37)-N6)-threonylcarbamoyltransferase complex ATPase subunit type 1 TsaE [candidate division KSB1 bacterium]
MTKIYENIVRSANETFQLGADFSTRLLPGSILTFKGELGAGKTTCIKGICAGLGVQQHVTSPTFTLINEYKGRIPVYHFDFYRIHSEFEVIDLGLTEYFEDDAVCLIEWPKVIEALLPEHRYEFHLTWDPATLTNTRHIIIYSA